MIVPTHFSDAFILTEIALKSKAFWGYSDAQIESWKDDLTITDEYLKKTTSFVYKVDNRIVGFYILQMMNMSMFTLEFLFVLPDFIGKGIGHQLVKHAIQKAKDKKGTVVNVLSDPNAEDFYAKHGFKTFSKKESSIPGRFLPEMTLYL